jgi:hypothetical protein
MQSPYALAVGRAGVVTLRRRTACHEFRKAQRRPRDPQPPSQKKN